MFSENKVFGLIALSALFGCGPEARPEPSTQDVTAARAYSETQAVPSSASVEVTEFNGLSEFGEVDNFTQMRLESPGSRLEVVNGTQVSVEDPSDLLVFFKAGTDSAAVVERARAVVASNCEGTGRCSGVVKRGATRYSLRELRAFEQWFLKSPLGRFSQTSIETPVLPTDGDSIVLRLVVEVPENTVGDVAKMFETAGVAEDGVRVATIRYYEAD